jgi:hypothetical protein
MIVVGEKISEKEVRQLTPFSVGPAASNRKSERALANSGQRIDRHGQSLD